MRADHPTSASAGDENGGSFGACHFELASRPLAVPPAAERDGVGSDLEKQRSSFNIFRGANHPGKGALFRQ